MQPTEFPSMMTTAADEVLSSMFFVGVESRLDEPDGPDSEWIAARLDFCGPHSGGFGIGAPLTTARMLASNFLGQEESELHSEQVVEAFCELSNMICGAFLGKLDGENLYDLAHPVPDPSFSRSQPGLVCEFLRLDEGQLRIWLALEAAP